jgi:hypothetical protein
MKRPIFSFLVAIGLLFLGSVSLAPYSPTRKQIAPDGAVTLRPESEVRFAELRVNWFAYLCFAGAGVSFAWTVYFIVAGVVYFVRVRHHDKAV